MSFKDTGYDDDRFWKQLASDSPTLLGFWTHQ